MKLYLEIVQLFQSLTPPPCYHNRTIKDDEKLLVRKENMYFCIRKRREEMKKIIAFLPYAIEYESTAAVAHIFMQQLFFRKCHALQKKEIESGMIFFILLFWWDIEDLVFFYYWGECWTWSEFILKINLKHCNAVILIKL